jgi:hypothetical protein
MPSMQRDIKSRIRAVARALREVWDPIGEGQMPDLPADEYDSYAPGIVGLLAQGASDDVVAARLLELELSIVGPPGRSAADLLTIVKAVRAAS